jgi:aspartyl/asparaginyl-tRNA synthetase
MVFFELRQSTDTVQALLQQSNEVSKQMVKWAGSITAESIVLIRGKVQKSPIEINATTIKDAEIHIAEVPYLVNPFTHHRSILSLPLLLGCHSRLKTPKDPKPKKKPSPPKTRRMRKQKLRP